MLEFWGDSPNFYSMTIQSPTGEQLIGQYISEKQHTGTVFCICRDKSVGELCAD